MDKTKERVLRRLRLLRSKLSFSGNIRAKLSQNYHVLSWPERFLYRAYYRRLLSAKDRFFFEGERGLPGQMYVRDREGLYDAVQQYKPGSCIEIGTWTGGGSTFFLAKAFEANGSGKLYTLETDPLLHRQAEEYYRKNLPSTVKHVEFVCGKDVSAFKDILDSFGSLDCCFLDGAEDSVETMEQYDFLKSYFRTGTILMAHDWNTEKMAKLAPVLLADKGWELVKKIAPPESVGFAVFRRR